MNEVKQEIPHISEYGCGRTEGGHMCAESKNDQSSALYLDANFEKAFKIDDISSVFHYELINDIGGLNSYVMEEKGGLICGDLDRMMDEDIIVNLHPTVSLINGFEDYVLDVDFSKKVPELDYHFCEELTFGNSSSEIHSPVSSNEDIRISKSLIPVAKCCNSQFEKTAAGGMHDVFESECGSDTLVKEEMALNCSLTCDLKDATNDFRSILEAGSPLDHNLQTTCFSECSTKTSCVSACMHYEVHPVSEDMEREDVLMDGLSSDSCSEVKIATTRQRRLCKPPQRYIEGSPWNKSRLHKAWKSPTSSLNDEDLGVCSKRKHYRRRKGPKATKSNLEHDSDDEYDPVPSKFNIMKSKKMSYGRKSDNQEKSYKKKSNNVWTLPEVEKLVDGLAHFGLGQWTAVKKAFFSSSKRTATDIRDKWRNLVKTNCRNLRRKREDDQHQRNGTQPLPKAVIERVRELANAHLISRPGSGRRAKLSSSRHHDLSCSINE